jgi:hypothetical protein
MIRCTSQRDFLASLCFQLANFMQAELKNSANRWVGTVTGDDRTAIVKRALSEACTARLKRFTLSFTKSETIGCRAALEHGKSVAN